MKLTTVKDVMTTRVVSMKKDTSFREMAAALRQHRVSAFPVVDADEKVIGVVSEADMLAKEALGSEPQGMPGMITGLLRHKEQAKARGITAGDLMSSPPVTVTPDDTVEHAAKLMYARKVKRLPVVDSGAHLVGIISRADVLAIFDRSDEGIRTEIRDQVIRDGFSIDPAGFSVIVKDGVVTLAGLRTTTSGTTWCTGFGTFRGSWPSAIASATRLARPSTRASMSWPASPPTDARPAVKKGQSDGCKGQGRHDQSGGHDRPRRGLRRDSRQAQRVAD
jgi:CBS domain-containing protein